MEFCPKCGSILQHKTMESGEQVVLTKRCQKCGYKSKDPSAAEKVDLKVINHTPRQMVAVIEKGKDLSTEPTVPIECPVCGGNKAYVWLVQTRGADESSTQFMRCTNCGYTFREST